MRIFTFLLCAVGVCAVPSGQVFVAPPSEAAAPAKKVGIAADWNSPQTGAGVAHFVNNRTAGHYNWSPWKFDNLPKGISFWPMLHDESSIKDWAHVKKGYADVAMGCNEVDQPGQANIPVARGVQIWNEHLLPLQREQGYKLVSHSTTQGASGLQWQRAWRRACEACHNSVWAYAVHWYGTDAAQFKKYVADFHKVVQKPVVVTEFACTDFSNRQQCDANAAKKFMDDVTGWMDKQPFVEAYFWFGMWPRNAMPGGVQPGNSLVNGDGTPTQLGKDYIAANKASRYAFKWRLGDIWEMGAFGLRSWVFGRVSMWN